MHLSLPGLSPLFVLTSSVCWSLQCLISALTQGGGGRHFFRLTCSVELCGERDAANNTGVCSQCPGYTGFAPTHGVCFPCLHCLGSRLLFWELSEAGPGLYALPKSKPPRFRYSGSPQRRRLSWACVLCPSQVQAAQVTRCLVSTVPATYHLPCACSSVFWVCNPCTFSGRC